MKKQFLLLVAVSAMILISCQSPEYKDWKKAYAEYEKAIDEAHSCYGLEKAERDLDKTMDKLVDKYPDNTLSQKEEAKINEIEKRIDEKYKQKAQKLCYDYEDDESSASSYESSTSSDSSENWDEVLDEYEKYVNEYIKCYKKAKNGDVSALSQYVDLLEKAEDLEGMLQDADDDNALSPQQIKRFEKIFEKLYEVLED